MVGFDWSKYNKVEFDGTQTLVRKHSYLHHRYLVGLAFIPRHWGPRSMLGGGARGQNLVHIQKIVFLR